MIQNRTVPNCIKSVERGVDGPIEPQTVTVAKLRHRLVPDVIALITHDGGQWQCINHRPVVAVNLLLQLSSLPATVAQTELDAALNAVVGSTVSQLVLHHVKITAQI